MPEQPHEQQHITIANKKPMPRMSLRHPAAFIPDYPLYKEQIKANLGEKLGEDDRNELLLYAMSIKDWLQNVFVFDGRSIPIIFSNPMRAFADFEKAVEEGIVSPWGAEGQSPDDAQLHSERFPLPFASISMDESFSVRTDVQAQGFPVRKLGYDSTSGKLVTGYTRYPTPILLPFQVDIYCRMYQHRLHFDKQFLMQFWNQIASWEMQHPLLTNHNGQPAHMLVPIRFGTHSQSYELEGGAADADRVLKTSYTFTVEGWLFDDVMQAPIVRRQFFNIQGSGACAGQQLGQSEINTITWEHMGYDGNTTSSVQASVTLSAAGDMFAGLTFGFWQPAANVIVQTVSVSAQSAPTGGVLQLQFLLNNVLQSQTVSLPAGQDHVTVALGTQLSVAAGAQLRMQIAAIGSEAPGSFVTVILNYQETVVGQSSDLS